MKTIKFLLPTLVMLQNFTVFAKEPELPQKVIDSSTFNAKAEKRLPSNYCCKVCKKGKACGDACIPAWKECHKGQGCACDG